VPGKLRDLADVPVKEVEGAGDGEVPETMRADGGSDGDAEATDQLVDRGAGKPTRAFAGAIEICEQRTKVVAAFYDPGLQSGLGRGGKGDRRCLGPPLTPHHETAAGNVHVRKIESNQLATAETNVVEQPEDGDIARCFPGGLTGRYCEQRLINIPSGSTGIPVRLGCQAPHRETPWDKPNGVGKADE
jgi:hypothetical protein